ncbi:MAG: hypothetical protein KGZ83_09930 [Sulfuricella sp.]|nr:hypothetical protein [Sulfuricella sp.]
MKRILLAVLLWTVSLLAHAGSAGLWKSDAGEYWLVLNKSDGSALAVQVDAKFSVSAVWQGKADDSSVSLTQAWPSNGTLSATLAQGKLSGTLDAGGKKAAFSATSPYAYLGSGVDGIYATSTANRYQMLATLLINGTAAPLLVDLDLGSKALEIYSGAYSVPSADTVQFAGKGLLKGADLSLAFSSSGISGTQSGAVYSATQAFKPALVETSQDYLGVYKTSTNYAQVASQGMKVINLPDEESYAVYWQPSSMQQGRVMVAVHGTDGTPYAELKDEIEFGTKYGYAVLGILWQNQRTKSYYSATQVYRIIHKALQHVKERYGNDLSRVAYVGFSRGSAVSYETTYLDRMGYRYFDLTISHSGGIPTSLAVAPTSSSDPDLFFSNLTYGRLGSNPLAGTKFFLYCGEKDEQWGTEMCKQFDNANSLIQKNGGTVVEFIRDADGTHAGYRANSAYHEKGVSQFISATP